MSITAYNCHEQITQISFHPYIVGLAMLGFESVWGYLPQLNSFYRFRIRHIRTFSLTGEKYALLPQPIYHYAKGEVHKAVLEGFDKIYLDGQLQDR